MKILFSLLFVVLITPVSAERIGVYYRGSEMMEFAAVEIQKSLGNRGQKAILYPLVSGGNALRSDREIVLLNLNDSLAVAIAQKAGIDDLSQLEAEGFLIYKTVANQTHIYIVGIDDAGVMYGAMEVAEIIQTQGIDAVNSQRQNPHLKVRGTKFNIPLDVRTPTYTEPSDAAQNNIEEMWSFDFWREYIDELARLRYNTISLWSMHPFPSMVKIPEYPDIALNEVRKSTVQWSENYSFYGWNLDAPEIVDNYKVVNKMTIDDKITFWRKVMSYGKKRNVQFYVLTWNIFTYGTEGKYGITDKAENPITTDYFRKSIKEMILTYPDLGGIGLTTGENMYQYNATQKEEWAFATYGLGVLDALKEQPNRKITFIHRQHETKASEISRLFKDIIEDNRINFLFSFKYAKAHVYSSVKQTFHGDYVQDISSENIKTLWTLRNDDIFYFRWGAPDFVRDFIKNIPQDVTEGYYYGSDQYVWGRNFMDKNRDGTHPIEIDKHWYQWMCWGRLGYNPDMSNARFIHIIQSRFPSVNAKEMFYAWQDASMIYPITTGFHWGALDFMWYIEGSQCRKGMTTKFHDVDEFISLKPHNGTGYMSIPDYTKAFTIGGKATGKTPLEVAEQIIGNADNALSWAERQKRPQSEELRLTIDDIKTMSMLGKYYAHKILAATYLSLFRETKDNKWHAMVIEELNRSAAFWRAYASYGLSNYQNPLWTNRVGYVDWKRNFKLTLNDITKNGGDILLPSFKPTWTGTILEAEQANGVVAENRVKGYTGSGYVASVGNAGQEIKWSYNAKAAGRYILELRYTAPQEASSFSPVNVNEEQVAFFEFWSSGNVGSWVWDRITIELKKGRNTISLLPTQGVLIDHLNLITTESGK